MKTQERLIKKSLGGRLAIELIPNPDKETSALEATYNLSSWDSCPSYRIIFDETNHTLVSINGGNFDGSLVGGLYSGRNYVAQLDGIIGCYSNRGIENQAGGKHSQWEYVVLFDSSGKPISQPSTLREKRAGLEKIAILSLAVEQALIIEEVQSIEGRTHSALAYLFEEMGYELFSSGKNMFNVKKQISQEKLTLPRILGRY